FGGGPAPWPGDPPWLRRFRKARARIGGPPRCRAGPRRRLPAPRALPIGRRDAAWPAAVVAAGDSGGGDACCVAAATALPAHPPSTRTGPAPADSSANVSISRSAQAVL